MNDEEISFSNLPNTACFKLMTVLTFIWSVAFTISIGSYMLLGPTLVAHLAILIAVFFTADIFRRTRSANVHHCDAMRNPRDGTALYDDMWGA